MDRSVRILAAITVLLAAVFLTMGRMIAAAPLGDWGLVVLLYLIGAALLFWDYYEGRPRPARAPADEDDSLALEAVASSPAPVREYLPQRVNVRPSGGTLGENALSGARARGVAPASDAVPTVVVDVMDDAAINPVKQIVSDPAVVLREDTPTPSISEIEQSTPAEDVIAPSVVGGVSAPEAEHPGATQTDAISEPRPYSAGAVSSISSPAVPHLTESRERENATVEHPPLTTLPQDKSVQATDKSAPANRPETTAVQEANNARQTTPQNTEAGVGQPIASDVAESAAPAVQQASAENADASTKAQVPDTPLPEAGDPPVPNAQDAPAPTPNVAAEPVAPAAAEASADATAAKLDLGTSPLEESSTDDLTRIEGIGPKIAAALNAEGVTTFSKLASLPEEEIRSILSKANLRIVGSVKASIPTWAEQAGMAARGEIDALKTWQAEHKQGGG